MAYGLCATHFVLDLNSIVLYYMLNMPIYYATYEDNTYIEFETDTSLFYWELETHKYKEADKFETEEAQTRVILKKNKYYYKLAKLMGVNIFHKYLDFA